jgi:hypothetical protein
MTSIKEGTRLGRYEIKSSLGAGGMCADGGKETQAFDAKISAGIGR